MTKIKYFILTGDPGIGKTTLTKKLCSAVAAFGVKPSGFYTEEVRRGGLREGFDVVTLDGQRACLARDCALNGQTKSKVGKYGVTVEEFEKVALPSLKQPEDSRHHFLVIDEIGKMELLSPRFKTRITEIFRPNSNCVVLATIPTRNISPIVESIRKNSEAKVWMVTRENRNTIHNEIVKQIQVSIDS